MLCAWTVMLASALGSACSSAHTGGAHPPTVIHVSERDFRIQLPARIPAGNVRLVVHNRGPDMHELIVVRASDPNLPLRSDAETVDEEDLEARTLGVLEPGAPGSTRALDLRLEPGTYEVFCNMAGHYLGGMSATFTVA